MPDRSRLLRVLATMPEEAFSWVVAWAEGAFPAGLGGFQPASRVSIEELRTAAKAYIAASDAGRPRPKR